MIIQIGTDADESRILWKYKESDEWKRADIDELIRAYENKHEAEMLESAKDTNVLTKDLIRKEDALREAKPEYLNPQQEKLASYNQGWNDALDEYFDRIKALQSAETQPITCDGCKHVGTYNTDFPCSG